jgi:hypothetical protein
MFVSFFSFVHLALDTSSAFDGIIASGPVAAVLGVALYYVVRWGREKDTKAEEAMTRALTVKVEEARTYADRLQAIKDAHITQMRDYKDSCQAVIKQKELEIADLHKENKQLYEKTWSMVRMIADDTMNSDA